MEKKNTGVETKTRRRGLECVSGVHQYIYIYIYISYIHQRDTRISVRAVGTLPRKRETEKARGQACVWSRWPALRQRKLGFLLCSMVHKRRQLRHQAVVVDAMLLASVYKRIYNNIML